jgi:hypothetical protein
MQPFVPILAQPLSYFCALFTWYLVQVRQTKYLIEVGFDPTSAAWALGLVSLVAVPGQIALAIYRIVSAANGYGRSAMAALCSVVRRSLLCPRFRRLRCCG